MITWKYGEVRIGFHPLFLVLLGLYYFVGVLPQALIVFGLVIIHELAHALVARQLGLKLAALELFPFGGVARLRDQPELYPWKEAVVALAGPAANLALLVGGLTLAQQLWWPPVLGLFFLKTNFFLFLFNLLPLLPLDGGRLLRAALAPRLGLRLATLITAGAGRWLGIIAILAGTAGIYYHLTDLNLIIVAGFLIYAAEQERRYLQFSCLRSLARRPKLKPAEVRAVRLLVTGPATPLQELVVYLTPEKYYFFVIVDNGRAMGMVNETHLLQVYFREGGRTKAGELL